MNKKFRPFYIGALAVAGVAMLGTSLVPRANADAWDKMTIVTVNEPIIAGSKVLQPGTYVWKLMDSPSDRHVVQIFDKDQRHLKRRFWPYRTTGFNRPATRASHSGKPRMEYQRPCAHGSILATTLDRSLPIRRSL